MSSYTCSEVSLVVLIGLPGSGKTTFSKYLAQYLEGPSIKARVGSAYCVIHICYDELMPISYQNHEDLVSWHEARKTVFNKVKALISKLRGVSDSESVSDNDIQNQNSILLDKYNANDGNRVVIIIDDNMFYRSMRYQYFQVARSFNVGFCQLYFHCELDEALLHNASRDKKSFVPEEIIRRVAERLEQPDNKQNIWEEHSCVLHSMEIMNQETLVAAHQLIDQAMKQPPQLVHVERDVDRTICSVSMLHQVDLALRKIVKSEMNKTRARLHHQDIQLRAKMLVERKQQVTEDVKKGEIQIPDKICLAVEECSSSARDQLCSFLYDFVIDKITS